MIKKITLTVAALLMAVFAASAIEMPKGHSQKTQTLAENFIECSKSGNYNKVYKSLRKIQKYQWQLEKEQIVQFYSDIHNAVQNECDRQGLNQEIKDNFREVIDSMFSMKMREDLEAASTNEAAKE